ncbi:MAG: hypothetical protein ACRD3O_21115 [Terriglobia bacterium]
MSEYQYYEFQAIDRPLTEDQMRELRSISSRAHITPTGFTNVYNFGDFKGNPARLVEKHFDAFLYLANWGTHKLTLRLPRQALDLEQAQCYCAGESASARVKGEFLILDFSSDDEGGDWEEGEGQLSSLIPLRADIAGGDYRALYVAWLLCAQNEESEDDATEPPCPPGLRTLSAPLRAFADFLRVDDDLIEAAAAGSAPLVELSLGEDFERWVSALPDPEKTALLVDVAKASESHVRVQLVRRFRAARESTSHSSSAAQPRRVGEILALAQKLDEERNRKEAMQRARREREAAVARESYLDGLAEHEPDTWAKIDTLIATKRPDDYDQAVQLLKDLSDMGLRSGRSEEIQGRIGQLRQQHLYKQSFLRRLDRALASPQPSAPLAPRPLPQAGEGEPQSGG